MNSEIQSSLNNKSGIPALLVYLFPPALLCLFVFKLWPYLQFYIDSDSISYLNIIKKYMEADYAHAINAFWSPMGCWLTVLLVKVSGWQYFGSAVFVNTAGTALLLIANQRLFNQFRSSRWEQLCFGIMSSVFWTYVVYYQPFTDVWQYLFLTIALQILMDKTFLHHWYIWILLGILGTLAFFSKAYSFYFFPLMLFIATCYWLKEAGNFNWKRLVTICFVVGIVMLAGAAPWLYLLHEKYGIWTSSTAGKLNSSWFLVGTQEFKSGIHIVVPPVYKGSLFYFEDPYLMQGKFVHFYDSFKMFLKQIARVGFNGLGWVSTDNRISPFFFATWLIVVVLLFRKQNFKVLSTRLKIITAIYLVYPLPFWLFTFEGGRYTWFILTIGSILSMILIDKALAPYLSAGTKKLFIAIFFLSYTVSPILDLKNMLHVGEKEHKIAEAFEKLNIQGSFVSNLSYADASISMVQIAWFSQNPWYCHTLSQYSTRQILEDAARYKVKYYFYFYNGTGEDYQLKDLNGVVLKDITNNSIEGVRVFQLSE